MVYKVNPLSFGQFNNQNQGQQAGGFRPIQERKFDEPIPGPISPEDEQGIIADFIDKFQQGAYGAAADVVTGARGLLTDDDVWEMEQLLRNQVTAQEDTLSTAQKEADANFSMFGTGDKEFTGRGFGGALFQGAGSLIPSVGAGIATGGVGAIASKALGMGAKAGQILGGATVGAPMIGGGAMNQVREELDTMPEQEFTTLPDFDMYYQSAMQESPDNPIRAMKVAREAYTLDAEQTAVKQGAALGAMTMGAAVPMLDKVVKGGAGFVGGVKRGAGTEFLQEGAESGGQEAVVNPLVGRERMEGVPEAAATGAILGGIIGGTAGGVGGLRGGPNDVDPGFTPIDVDAAPYTETPLIKGGLQPVTDTRRERPVMEPGPGRQGVYPTYAPGPTQAEQNEADITSTMEQEYQRELADNEIKQAEQRELSIDELDNDPVLIRQALREGLVDVDEAQRAFEIIANAPKPIEQEQEQADTFPKPDKSLIKMDATELSDYHTVLEDYKNIAPEIDTKAIDEIQGRVNILQRRANKPVDLIKGKKPTPLEERRAARGVKPEPVKETPEQKERSTKDILTDAGVWKDFARTRKDTKDEIAAVLTDPLYAKDADISANDMMDLSDTGIKAVASSRGIPLYTDRGDKKSRNKLESEIRGNVPKAPKAREAKQPKKTLKDVLVDKDGYHSKLVERAYAHSSNSPGRAATIHKREFNDQVKELTESGDKLAKTPKQKEALKLAVDKFKQDYMANERSLMSARSGVVSGHIAGRSKFNAKQAGKRGNALDRAQERFNDWLDKAKYDVEKSVQDARTPEAAAQDRKEAKAKREKSEHTGLMKDIAGSLAAMVEPGMEPAAFRPKATKKLREALGRNEDETLRLMEVINKALKDKGGIEKAVGPRSNFWKMYKAVKDKKQAEQDKVETEKQDKVTAEREAKEKIEALPDRDGTAKTSLERLKKGAGKGFAFSQKHQLGKDVKIVQDEIVDISDDKHQGYFFGQKMDSSYESDREDGFKRAEEILNKQPVKDEQGRTPAQLEAGNYKKVHKSWNGLDISIENEKGTKRSGTDEDGKAWETTMANDYGYIKRTEGADGDHVDVFVGPNQDSNEVFIVNQTNKDKKTFDEHKVMLGFDNAKDAEKAYLANYENGWNNYGEIAETTVDGFKTWLKEDTQKKPAKFDNQEKYFTDKTNNIKNLTDKELRTELNKANDSEKISGDRRSQYEKDYREALIKESYERSGEEQISFDGEKAPNVRHTGGKGVTRTDKLYYNTETTDKNGNLILIGEDGKKKLVTPLAYKQQFTPYDKNEAVIDSRWIELSQKNINQLKKIAKLLNVDGKTDKDSLLDNIIDEETSRYNKTGELPGIEEAEPAPVKETKPVEFDLYAESKGGAYEIISVKKGEKPRSPSQGVKQEKIGTATQEQWDLATDNGHRIGRSSVRQLKSKLQNVVGPAPAKERDTLKKRIQRHEARMVKLDDAKTFAELDKIKAEADEDKNAFIQKRHFKEHYDYVKKNLVEGAPEYTIDHHNTLVKKLNTGDMTIEEFKKSAKNFKDSKDDIMTMLNSRKYTVKQLRGMAGYMMRGDEKKAEIAENVFDRLQTLYLLDNPRPNLTWTMGVGNMQKGVDEQQAKINKLIDGATQENLDNYAKGIKDAQAKREADKKAREEALKDPKTLEDFRAFKSTDDLTPEQLETFDRLMTDEMINRRKEIADREASRQAKSIGDVDVETAETTHTKTGQDLYVVKLPERIERERFNTMRRLSKQYDGFYSRYNVGDAIPGFQFKSESAREEFIAAVSTGEVKTKAKPKTNQERIAEMGDRLIDKGKESLNQDRQTNTARRAGMAASAEAAAEGQIRTGELLKGIANADTDYLHGITALTQLEELQKVLNRAEYKAPDELKDKDSMSRKTLKKGVTLNDYIQHAKFPSPVVRRDGLQSLARDLEGKKGYMNVARAINSVLKKTKSKDINLDNYSNIDQAKIKKYAKLPGVYGSSTWIADYIQSSERLEKIGITSLPHLRMALRELNKIQQKVSGVSPEQEQAKKLKTMERELVGKKIAGFFPTPKPVISRMMDEAEIGKDDTVLEPSAGKGDIADAVKDYSDNVDSIEFVSDLRDILKEKGHNVVANDFLKYDDKKYDKIVMNPPFENFQDIDHVRHAYDLLNDGGRVVAIMGAGVNNTRKKAVEFRAWVEENGGTIEELPTDSFKGKDAFRQTGVNTVLVTIDKDTETLESKSKPAGTITGQHSSFSFVGVDKPAGLSEQDIFNIINDKYGRPLFGASKFKNLNIINDPGKKWRGQYNPKTKKMELNAYYLSEKDAVRVLHHEKVHEHIRKDRELVRVAKAIMARAKKYPDSPAGKAYEIALDRTADKKDKVKNYDNLVLEETLAYLVQYYNKPGNKSALKPYIDAIRKFFSKYFKIFMNEDAAVDYVNEMVGTEVGQFKETEIPVLTKKVTPKKQPVDDYEAELLKKIEDSYESGLGDMTKKVAEKFESDWMDNTKSYAKRHLWGTLNVRQISEILGKYAPVIKSKYIDRFKLYESDMNEMKQQAGDIANVRQDLDKAMNESLAEVQHEATIESFDPSFEKPETPEQQSIKTKYLTLDAKAKKVYKDERDYHNNMHNTRLAELKNRINFIEGDEGFKEIMIDKVTEEFAKANKKGPYFPLARFGQFWVSSENAAGEKSFDMFENEIAQKRFVDELRSTPGEDVLGFGKQLDKLDSVSKGIDSKFVAEVDKLVTKAGGDNGLRDDIFQLYLESLPELSSRKKYLHRKKTKGFSNDQAKAFAQKARSDANDIARIKHIHVLQDMIEQTEVSLNIASSRTLKAQFSSHAAALQKAIDETPFAITDEEIDNLNQQAPFKTFRLQQTSNPEKEIQRILDKEKSLLKNADKIDETKITFVSNGLSELKAAHDAMVNSNVHPIASGLNSLGFLWYLGASPAAALVNLTQTPTVALPMMLADKALKGSAGHLTKAVADFMKGKGSIEPTLNAAEKKAFEFWHKSGLLENTQAHDLSGIADSGIDTGTFKNKAMRMISFMFHRAEVMNREVTALATYRAAIDGGMQPAAAMKKASDLTWDSHLDYGASNRARFMRGNFARVITQFKQYSQGITYIYARTAFQAFKGENAADRKQAQKLLAMLMGSQVAVAGTMGLPMAGIVMGMAQGLEDAFGDDDDPVSMKAEFRQALSGLFGKTGGQAISHGLIDAFTPLSVSGRLSMSDLWIRTPDYDLEGKSEALAYIEALGGPMVGLFTNLFMAKQSFKDGDYLRAFESMTPKHIKDFIRAGRYAGEGNLTKAGLEIKDMSPAEMIAQALGFSASEVSEIRERATGIKNIERKRTTRRKDIINAWIAGDDVMDEIQEWNSKHSRDRITGDTLRKAKRSKLRYARQVTKGVRETKRNRDLTERYDY